LLFVLLLLFALGLFAMRRFADLFFDRTDGAGAAASADGAGGPDAPVDLEALRAELDESRAVRNRVLRRWLREDPERVALLVQLLGAGIVRDLKNDEHLAEPLERVSRELAAMNEPLEDDDIEQLARELRARLNAARVTQSDAALAGEWDFLEGLSAAQLRRVLAACSPGEQIYVAGKLPGPLRASYLEGLDEEERREFLLAGEFGELDKHEARALAARLRKRADDIAHVDGELDVHVRLVADLLEALGADEQLESVEQLRRHRPEVARKLMSRTCLQAAIPELPDDLLAEAVHQLPIDTLSTFLARADERVQKACVSAAPESKRQALQTELSLDIPVSRRAFFEARSRVTERIAEMAHRGAYDLEKANERALQRATTAGQTSPSHQEV
ncbi:MAG: FliG C-terminal domain-containing protein, partial [Persicimonas sp.]